MKVGNIRLDGFSQIVVQVTPGGAALVRDVYELAGETNPPSSFQDVVEDDTRRLASIVAEATASPDLNLLDEARLDWQPPQPRPLKIIGVAFNNAGIRKAAHVDPGVPNFFLKAASSLVGFGKPVIIKQQYGHTMPEPELVVVIGKKGKDIPVEKALDYVYGYSVTDDVTSHGMKFGMDSIATTREPGLLLPEHLAWRHRRGRDDRDVYFVYHARSKSTDTFGPMAAYITTRDEISDPNRLRVDGWIDGEPFSSDTTGTYTYSVEEIVAEASRYFTLEPGDLFSCGTSAKGVGNFPNAHRNINFQDRECEIEIEIEGLGKVRHPVIHDWKR